MIPSVNFIEKVRFRWTYKNFILLCAVLGIASLVLGLWERYSVARLQARVQALRASVQGMQRDLNLSFPTVAVEDRQLEPTDPSSKEVFALYEELWGTPKWSLVLGEVFASLPRGMVLDTLEKKDDRTLRILGHASRSELLSRWMDALRVQSTIGSTQLLSTGAHPEGGSLDFTFEMDVMLRGPS